MRLIPRWHQICIFAVLTLLTQIGGVAYLLSMVAASAMGVRRAIARLFVCVVGYAAATTSATVIAPSFGRIPISCLAGEADRLVAQSMLYCLLNRNYVTPAMRDLVSALARQVDQKFPGTTTVVLDGNFPFWDGFPLLPHLSHADGRKLDIAFYYKDSRGNFLDRTTRSPIGYFAFEQPATGDARPCAARRDILTARWDFDWLQPWFPDHRIEERRMVFVLQWLATEGVERFGLEKVFIEPHLRDALGVTSSVIRFQGCRAARHDDHLHVQIR